MFLDPETTCGARKQLWLLVMNRNAPLMLMMSNRPTILLATLLISVTVDMKLKKPLRAFFMSVI
ncbi:hypothetical protein P4S81_04285 [Pseudoalteromonas sp. B28]